LNSPKSRHNTTKNIHNSNQIINESNSISDNINSGRDQKSTGRPGSMKVRSPRANTNSLANLSQANSLAIKIIQNEPLTPVGLSANVTQFTSFYQTANKKPFISPLVIDNPMNE